MTRRGFLGACLASTVLVSVPALALGGSSRAEKAKRGLSLAMGAKIKGARKALLAERPTSTPVTKTEYKARAANLTTKINSVARTRAAAAGAAAAEKKALVGLAGGMARLAGGRWGTAFRALNFLGIGLTLYTVGEALWDAFMGVDTPKDDCEVGTLCRKYNADGTYEIRTTTFEYADASSSWSLNGSGLWYAYKNVRIAAANGAKGYYKVHWVWRPGNGRTAESFDATVDLYPYTRGVGLTDAQEKLRAKGLLDKTMTKADIAAIVDTAVRGAIANDANDWPAAWNGTAGPPKLDIKDLTDSFSDTFEQAIGSLFDNWTDTDTDLFDPEVVGEAATDDLADDGTPLPTPGSTPTPTPTPGGSTGGGTGGGGGTTTPPGDPVEPEGDLELPGWSTLSAPFKGMFAPVTQLLDPGAVSCPTIPFPWFGSRWGDPLTTIQLTQLCDIFTPVAAPMATVSAVAGVIAGARHVSEA